MIGAAQTSDGTTTPPVDAPADAPATSSRSATLPQPGVRLATSPSAAPRSTVPPVALAPITPAVDPAVQYALAPERLRWRCDPATLGFETTDEVPPLAAMCGQDRGVDAVAFGLGLEVPGYNLYVAGPPGTGRTTTVRAQVAHVAAGRASPQDWCYLHNFRDPSQPLAVSLPTGKGPELARHLQEFVTVCRREIPKVFESETYQQRRASINQALQERRDAIFERLRTLAASLDFGLQITPMGVATVALLEPGKPLSSEAFDLLTDEKQQEIRSNGQRLDTAIGEARLTIRRMEREAHEQMEALDREAVLFAIGHLLETLSAKYTEQPQVVRCLEAIQVDLLDHLDDFREREESPARNAPPFTARTPAYEHYRVNVLVTHDPGKGAPVVFEPNPTYYNLLGRVEYRATIGAMYTDLTLIKPGALQRANGGFLILRVRDLLTNPFSWEALKRALRESDVRPESLGEQLSAVPTEGLRPEAIPLRVKVILIGDVRTYHLLHQLDEDFSEFFKVKAEFGAAMNRTAETAGFYAAFVASQAREHSLPPFHCGAVARVLEHGARLMEHQERLSTRFDVIANLVMEAGHRARAAGAEQVLAEHVDRTLDEQQRRANLVEDEIQRLIDEGTIAIDTDAPVPGQVNGLSVTDLGDYAFGRPSRITARTGMGAEGVVDVEREIDLSGPSHSKGVLILGGYLLGTYGQEHPLALSARLTFEQVYGGVDGDSASSAELYAVLSSLSDLPLRQDVAVTGSVDQRGHIQAVGGVTAKVEGFYAVCKARGLTGRQGVIIPATNVRHLMLKPEVVDAVAAGRFHVWAVRTVDEGIELLSGTPAGQRAADGTFPPGSVHALVQHRLTDLASRMAAFGSHRRPGALPGGRNGSVKRH